MQWLAFNYLVHPLALACVVRASYPFYSKSRAKRIKVLDKKNNFPMKSA